MQLPPIARHCFVLQVLFGISVPDCATNLGLTREEFQQSLRSAFEHLATSSVLSAGSTDQTKERALP